MRLHPHPSTIVKTYFVLRISQLNPSACIHRLSSIVEPCTKARWNTRTLDFCSRVPSAVPSPPIFLRSHGPRLAANAKPLSSPQPSSRLFLASLFVPTPPSTSPQDRTPLPPSPGTPIPFEPTKHEHLRRPRRPPNRQQTHSARTRLLPARPRRRMPAPHERVPALPAQPTRRQFRGVPETEQRVSAVSDGAVRAAAHPLEGESARRSRGGDMLTRGARAHAVI